LSLAFLLCALALPRVADAAPVTVGGKASTDGGASGAASGPARKAFELPENIIGGNAITALLPVQVGFAGYIPRVRLGFQYERQLYKAHWVYLQVAGLMDRGNWQTFRLPDCGLGNTQGS